MEKVDLYERNRRKSTREIAVPSFGYDRLKIKILDPRQIFGQSFIYSTFLGHGQCKIYPYFLQVYEKNHERNH